MHGNCESSGLSVQLHRAHTDQDSEMSFCIFLARFRGGRDNPGALVCFLQESGRLVECAGTSRKCISTGSASGLPYPALICREAYGSPPEMSTGSSPKNSYYRLHLISRICCILFSRHTTASQASARLCWGRQSRSSRPPGRIRLVEWARGRLLRRHLSAARLVRACAMIARAGGGRR